MTFYKMLGVVVLVGFLGTGIVSESYGQAELLITLDAVNNVSQCNQEWVEAGVKLSFVATTSEDCSEGWCYFGIDDMLGGVWLYPSRLNLDLSGLAGTVTHVEVFITDYCGTNCTRAFLYQGQSQIDVTGNPTTGDQILSLDNPEIVPIDRIAVSSCEGFIWEIRITIQDIQDPCDLNEDGAFTFRDTAIFYKGCKEGTADWECDLDGNGRFNIADIIPYIRQCKEQEDEITAIQQEEAPNRATR